MGSGGGVGGWGGGGSVEPYRVMWREVVERKTHTGGK